MLSLPKTNQLPQTLAEATTKNDHLRRPIRLRSKKFQRAAKICKVERFASVSEAGARSEILTLSAAKGKDLFLSRLSGERGDSRAGARSEILSAAKDLILRHRLRIRRPHRNPERSEGSVLERFAWRERSGSFGVTGTRFRVLG